MKRIVFTEEQIRKLMDSVVSDLIIEQDTDDDNDMDDLGDQPQREPKRKTPIQILKEKWVQENPILDDNAMDQAITFFNRYKNGLRPYKDPQSAPVNYVNLPEITAMVVAFPDMKPILTDPIKIRDIQNYTWEQLNYYIERTSTEIEQELMDVHVEGDTINDKIRNAYEKWNQASKIINEDGFMVIRIESMNESIALSRLQHLIQSKIGIGAKYCVGYLPGESTNYYYTYRKYSSYYFVLDINKEMSDNYHISVIQVIDPNSDNAYRGPYFLTPLSNGTRERQEWNDIVNVHPKLNGKQHLFKYFGTTSKEIDDAALSKINFTPNSSYFFGKQSVVIQKKYIQSGRLIQDKLSFSTLPYSKENNLRKDYIAATTNADYVSRFTCNEPSDPFGILRIIERETPALYRYLDEFVLKQTLNLPMGVWGIKIKIIGKEYTAVYKDMNSGLTLYKQKRGESYGVMDIDDHRWEKDMNYILTTTSPLIKLEDRSQYLLQRFTSEDGDDIFYFLLNRKEYLKKDSPNYGKGIYLNKENAEEIIASGKFRKIGYGN